MTHVISRKVTMYETYNVHVPCQFVFKGHVVWHYKFEAPDMWVLKVACRHFELKKGNSAMWNLVV